jgi:hypothetical protein
MDPKVCLGVAGNRNPYTTGKRSHVIQHVNNSHFTVWSIEAYARVLYINQNKYIYILLDRRVASYYNWLLTVVLNTLNRTHLLIARYVQEINAYKADMSICVYR